MCRITATELKNNLGHYLELSKVEDVYVTKNNKIISVLTNPDNKSFVDLDALMGKYNPKNEKIDYDKILEEEIFKKCGFQQILIFFSTIS